MQKKGKEPYRWFAHYRSVIMRDSMLKSIRTNAGLGDPSRNFNTNRVESLNSLLKLETNGPLPINKYVEKIKKLVERQQRDVIWALIGKGSNKLYPSVEYLQVDSSVWMNWNEVKKYYLIY